MSYFDADTKIPIEQTSISIPSENGLSYNSTQIIEISVPPTPKFIQPKESYLNFNVKIKGDSAAKPARLQLDSEIGANILIKDIRIYDGTKNTLLEEITDYNTLVAVKYDYETNQSLKNKRALTEGATLPVPSGRSTRGATETSLNQVENNPYFAPAEGNQSVAWSDSNYRDAKVCLPLHTGIFQNDRVFPLLLTNGLHLSITLEDNSKVFRTLDSVALNRRTTLNPIFHSIDNSASGLAGNGSDTKTFYVDTENNMKTVDNFPFVVGQAFSLYDMANDVNASWTTNYPVISEISTSGGKILVETSVSATLAATPGGVNATGGWCFIDESVDEAATYNPTYTISNVELVLQQISVDKRYEAGMMAKMKEGGTISYDFLSVTNYRYSQLVSDRVANIQLPIQNSRAKSIICVPTDSSVYTSRININSGDNDATETYQLEIDNNRNHYNYSCRSGMVGISDYVTNYVFNYDSKLQPSRNVDLSKTSSKFSISQQALIENDKALTSAGINTHSMRNYSQNFIIGRALSLGSGVYDARNKQFALQVNYQEATAPEKPKLWKNYVFHIRRLNIKGESVSVEL